MSEIKVNEIPSLTWNWMKMNRDSVTIDGGFTEEKPEVSNLPKGFSIGKAEAIDLPLPGSGICNKTNPKLNAEKTASSADEVLIAANNENHPVNQLVNEVAKNKDLIKISGKAEEPVILDFTKGGNTISAQTIVAEENSEGTVIFVYSSKDEENITKIIKTEVYAKENAQLHIIKVQLLGSNALQLDDTGITAMDSAKVRFTQIELGGNHVDSGLHVSLKGYKSAFESNVAYICQNTQKLDFNHVVYHYAQKTECNMKVNGTLKDEAQKTYRGTIDFKKGCAASVGHEIEETLLLNPKVVNKSLPVILCDEEDVEGTHGASIGRLSADILFYMQTRGISKEEAEKLMSRAKIQAVADLIPNEEIKAKISDFLAE